MDDTYQKILQKTQKMCDLWSSPLHGWAPESAADLLSTIRLDWHLSLTQCLQIWIDKDHLTDGELILAWANLGTLVENNLKLFLCVYYEDYKEEAGDKAKSPDEARFNTLINFIWPENSSKEAKLPHEWREYVDKIRKNRNAIHAFKNADITDNSDFLESVKLYYNFLKAIDCQLPPY